MYMRFKPAGDQLSVVKSQSRSSSQTEEEAAVAVMGGNSGSKRVGDTNTVSFNLNSVPHTITDAEIGPSVTLATYIREYAHLTGTKVSCNEGGCGACILTVQKSEQGPPRSLNSCLIPVLACDGWSITTVEGLGGRTQGYHPIQAKLASEGGSQCGYCSSGMVMQLNSWMAEHPQATMLDIDAILDGNICRCTGYRPILDAFKSFASDFPGRCQLPDIEELKLCSRTGAPCAGSCAAKSAGGCRAPREQFEWFVPTTLAEVRAILAALPAGTKYRLVAANTGTGVFKNDGPFSVFINLNKVAELQGVIATTPQLIIGANTTITDTIDILRQTTHPVWAGVADHLQKIASYGIRNQGTLAGNLMMKQAHTDFPSDVFLTLATVGAVLEIVGPTGAMEELAVGNIGGHNMDRKIIASIKLPELAITEAQKMVAVPDRKDINALWRNTTVARAVVKQGSPLDAGPEWKYRSFKVMPRSSNAHAYVNAGFLALVDSANHFRIVGRPSIVFGGISSSFVHARATEEFLQDRPMDDHNIFLEALAILAEELVLEEEPVLASPLYRKQLAMGLFYKFFLFVLGPTASSAVQSGATDILRGLSSGVQEWETDESQWPITQPVEKVEAKVQCGGEAEYVADIQPASGELHAAFVMSGQANCSIVSVDTTAALAMPGVLEYIDAKDIPTGGTNNWKRFGTPEPVFAAERSEYAGQAVGLIVAETRTAAIEAAAVVSITYANKGPVIVDMAAAMTADPANVQMMGGPVSYGDVDAALAAADTVVSGRFRMGSQYHFHMETHICIARPTEDGLDLLVPTQDIAALQGVVAKVLNVPNNSLNISVRRLGGAYGGKIELPTAVAAATAVAANKLKRPVRLWMPLEHNMRMFGKRNPYLFDYKIGFDKERKIVGVVSDLYADGGWNFNGVDSSFAVIFGQSCYHIPALRFTPYGVRTNIHTHTAVRAPGMCNGHAMLEAILEHAAVELGLEPLQLRLNNLMVEGSPILPPPATLPTPCPIPEMMDLVTASATLEERKAAAIAFNESNRWKKRGISVVPMRYDHSFTGYGLKYHCLLSVFAEDGTVSVTVGGIEMGQGLNTKVAQVIAKELGISMDLIKLKASSAITSPNNSTTGGSMGSEMNCFAAIRACADLNERLAPVRADLPAGATWQQVIAAANGRNIDLCAKYMMNPDRDNLNNYSVWGVVVTEVEVDILTGENRIVRVDLLEDAGLSTSPQVDIGQVEGAFVMGLGLWTSEEVKHDPTTGDLLTKNTWEYKPPAAKDIPEDFRVTLLKNARNPNGVLSSKATGEPAVLMSVSVLFALRNALNSSRENAGLSGWWQLDGPATVEKVHQHAGLSPDQFVF